MERPELAPFTVANSRKMSWSDRVRLIERQFPSTKHLDWKALFDQDIEIFGRILKDVLKADQAAPGRPGPRPGLDHEVAARRLRQFMGSDYSMLPFSEALGVLANGKSYRAIAAKTGLNRNTIYRLQKGMIEPDSFVMEQVAKAYGKHPSYFIEWRVGYVVGALMKKLESDPEISISVYRKLRQDEDE